MHDNVDVFLQKCLIVGGDCQVGFEQIATNRVQLVGKIRLLLSQQVKTLKTRSPVYVAVKVFSWLFE